jgi:hypothetical protein
MNVETGFSRLQKANFFRLCRWTVELGRVVQNKAAPSLQRGISRGLLHRLHQPDEVRVWAAQEPVARLQF